MPPRPLRFPCQEGTKSPQIFGATGLAALAPGARHVNERKKGQASHKSARRASGPYLSTRLAPEMVQHAPVWFWSALGPSEEMKHTNADSRPLKDTNHPDPLFRSGARWKATVRRALGSKVRFASSRFESQWPRQGTVWAANAQSQWLATFRRCVQKYEPRCGSL